MELFVQRERKDAEGIPGELLNGSQHIGWTLERTDVAIPTGRFQVKLYDSPHFGRLMPWIQIPTRQYILMHWGSFPKNSNGCILTGETQDLKDDEIFGTRDEFEYIFPLIEAAVNGEGCWVTVKDPPMPTLGNDFEQVEDAALGEN
jgi:hypothetical protein